MKKTVSLILSEETVLMLNDICDKRGMTRDAVIKSGLIRLKNHQQQLKESEEEMMSKIADKITKGVKSSLIELATYYKDNTLLK